PCLPVSRERPHSVCAKHRRDVLDGDGRRETQVSRPRTPRQEREEQPELSRASHEIVLTEGLGERLEEAGAGGRARCSVQRRMKLLVREFRERSQVVAHIRTKQIRDAWTEYLGAWVSNQVLRDILANLGTSDDVLAIELLCVRREPLECCPAERSRVELRRSALGVVFENAAMSRMRALRARKVQAERSRWDGGVETRVRSGGTRPAP